MFPLPQFFIDFGHLLPCQENNHQPDQDINQYKLGQGEEGEEMFTIATEVIGQEVEGIKEEKMDS